MSFRSLYPTRFFQMLFLLALSPIFQGGDATASLVMSPRSTVVVISIDPALPKAGEAFTINISGKWRNQCIPDQNELTHEINEYTRPTSGLKGASFHIETTETPIDDCGGEYEATPFNLSVPVQSSNWDEMNVTFAVSESPDREANVSRFKEFDMVLGIHDIPPKLHSGYWISEATPSQGLLVQQQGSTVVFYELTYNRVSGEPNWLGAHGEFHGNKLQGVAYLVNWLSPVEGGRQGFIMDPDYDFTNISLNLVQPEQQELSFDAGSAGIIVIGVNRIIAFVGYHDGIQGPNSTDTDIWAVSHRYKPWVFNLDDSQLPPVIPNMIGIWNLYGFSGQNLEQTHQIDFNAGTKTGNDEYLFTSSDEEWILECRINLYGEGDCTLTNEALGISMNYYLNKSPSDVAMENFNGNYTKAPLVSSNSADGDQTGILLRSGVPFPVLDLQ